MEERRTYSNGGRSAKQSARPSERLRAVKGAVKLLLIRFENSCQCEDRATVGNADDDERGQRDARVWSTAPYECPDALVRRRGVGVTTVGVVDGADGVSLDCSLFRSVRENTQMHKHNQRLAIDIRAVPCSFTLATEKDSPQSTHLYVGLEQP